MINFGVVCFGGVRWKILDPEVEEVDIEDTRALGTRRLQLQLRYLTWILDFTRPGNDMKM
jgi:hypothetical protein